MMRMHHRPSKVIDLLLRHAQWLARLTPRLNDRIAGVIGVAPHEILDFCGRKILLEATERSWPRSFSFGPPRSSRATCSTSLRRTSFSQI
jgi:hypothetical protein